MLSKPPNASKEMIIGSILRNNENGCVVVYGKLTQALSQGKILLRNKSALASPEQSLLNCCTKRKSQNQCYVLYHYNQVHFWTDCHSAAVLFFHLTWILCPNLLLLHPLQLYNKHFVYFPQFYLDFQYKFNRKLSRGGGTKLFIFCQFWFSACLP